MGNFLLFFIKFSEFLADSFNVASINIEDIIIVQVLAFIWSIKRYNLRLKL